MTPPTFQMGDEVKTANGTRFKISQLWEKPDGSFAYSDPSLRWHSADNLRLVNKKPLSPMQVTYNHKPDDCEHGTFQISCPCGRKVEIDPKLDEELKIGDYVEVIGPCLSGYTKIADRFRISQKGASEEVSWYSTEGEACYPATSLRKLTPKEIKQHQVVPMPAKLDEIQELRRRIHDLEMSLNGFTNGPEPEHVPGISYVKDPIRDRLSAIEKRQEEARKYSDDLYSITETLAERIYALQKRVEFVEKIQRTEYKRNGSWAAGP